MSCIPLIAVAKINNLSYSISQNICSKYPKSYQFFSQITCIPFKFYTQISRIPNTSNYRYFVVRVCWLFWGWTLHKTWQNTKGGHVCSYNQPIEAFRLRISCRIKGLPKQILACLFVCLFDVYRPS